MKKCMMMICCAFLMLCASVTLFACNKEHDHTCSDWTEIVDATCTSEGLKTGFCEICGEEFSVVLEKLPHTPHTVSGFDATCTETGLTDGEICSVCETWLTPQQEIAAKGHSMPQTWDVIEEATCQKTGFEERRCLVCGHLETHVIELADHKYGQWNQTKAPTCTAQGEKERTCEVCSHKDKALVDMIAHNFDENSWQTIVEASCTQEGVLTNTCTICKTYTETKIVEKLAHTPQKIDGTPATCEDDGLSEGQKCSVCNTILVQQTVVHAIGHAWGNFEQLDTDGQHKRICQNNPEHVDISKCNYADPETVDATCLEGAYTKLTCIECQDIVKNYTSEALGHSLGNWTEIIVEGGEESEGHTHKHYRICSRCNDPTTREEQPCDLQFEQSFEATCTTAAYNKHVCDKCGSVHEEITAPANGHDLQYEFQRDGLFGKHRSVCTNCDYKSDFTACTNVHSLERAATCEEDAKYTSKCRVCNNVLYSYTDLGTKLGHIMSGWEFCGSREDRKHEQHCTRDDCDYSVTAACHVVTTKTPSTCTSDGQITENCDICATAFTSQGEVSVGHQWTPWVSTPEGHTHSCTVCGTSALEEHDCTMTHQLATCTEAEYDIFSCKYCSYQRKDKVAEANGHSWQVSYISEDSHQIECLVCQAKDNGAHDWSDSNLCSGCQYDGLNYHLEGIHCYVENDNRVTNAKHIVIPDKHKVLDGIGGYLPTEYTVTSIGESAFYSHRSMETLLFPHTVTSIGDHAFLNCTSLNDVQISEGESSLTTIGDFAFQECRSLVTFDPPTTLTTIGQYAFDNCANLVNITLGEEVQHIGFCAFRNTGFVKDGHHWVDDLLYIGKYFIKARHTQNEDGSFSNSSITLSDGTKAIAAYAFSDCTNLTEIVLPNSLQVIDSNAFFGCNSISRVEFLGDLRAWLSIEFGNDYSSPLWHGNASFHIQNAHDEIDLHDVDISKIPAGTFKDTGIVSVILPETITYIGESAFENCTNLMTITIPETAQIKYVGKNAFKNCGYYSTPGNWDENGVLYIGTILVEAKTTLPENLVVKAGTVAIADYAFVGCTQLKQITINASCIRVGSHAFDGCTAMNTLIFEDHSYDWFCSQEQGIGRVYYASEMSWWLLRLYDGGWTRRAPVVAE